MNAECQKNVPPSLFGHAGYLFSKRFPNLKRIFAACIEKYKHGFTSRPLITIRSSTYQKQDYYNEKKWLRTAGKPLAYWSASTVERGKDTE
jgi:hypothetical protein